MTIARAAARDSALSALPIDLPLLFGEKWTWRRLSNRCPQKGPRSQTGPLYSPNVSTNVDQTWGRSPSDDRRDHGRDPSRDPRASDVRGHSTSRDTCSSNVPARRPDRAAADLPGDCARHACESPRPASSPCVRCPAGTGNGRRHTTGAQQRAKTYPKPSSQTSLPQIFSNLVVSSSPPSRRLGPHDFD